LVWFYNLEKETPSANVLTGIDCLDFPKVGSATCIDSNNRNAKQTVLIWGDSHSLALRSDVVVPKNINIISIGHDGCAPLIRLYRFDGMGNYNNCDNAEVMLHYAKYINKVDPDIVVLAGRWPLYFNGWERKGVRQSPHHMLTNTDENIPTVLNSDSFRKELLLSSLNETANYLAAEKVYVLISPPDLADIGLTRSHVRKGAVAYSEIAEYNSAVQSLRDKKESFDVIDSRGFFCVDAVCKISVNGFSLYADDNHVSFLGSRLIWEEVFVRNIFRSGENYEY